MNKKLSRLSLLLTLCFSSLVNAQDAPHLRVKIENSIHSLNASWKLSSDNLYPRMYRTNYETLFLTWKSGDSFVTAIILVHSSVQDTSKTYNGLSSEFGIDTLRMKISEEVIPNLGDANHVWDDYYGSNMTGILFKKGKVFVHITALSKEVAREFAERIADCIPAA